MSGYLKCPSCTGTLALYCASNGHCCGSRKTAEVGFTEFKRIVDEAYKQPIKQEKQPMKIYLIGSLREPTVPGVAERLRAEAFEVFDDWHGAGPRADDEWQRYETTRGRSYGEALAGYNAEHVFSFDKKHLDRCDAAVLVGPAGRSAHLELGYMIGSGKPGYVLFDAVPERWDVMYKFATRVCFDLEALADTLARLRRSHDVFGPKVMS